jgi:uncharacterized phage protein (TIGR02220 family)
MIYRIKKDKNYSVISNIPIQDKNLTWGAKGLLTYLLHLPDDWKINIQDLKNRSINGRDGTRRLLNELIEKKYIIKEKARAGDGKFSGFDYTVYEQPQTEFPSTGNPNTDNPNTEFQPLLNTNSSNMAELDKLNVPNTKPDSIESLSFYCPYCLNKTEYTKLTKDMKIPGFLCAGCKEEIDFKNNITYDKFAEFCKSMNKNYKYYTLAELLYKEHLKSDNKFLAGKDLVKTFLRWANDIRLLCENDGRDRDIVKEIIIWCQKPGSFWVSNIRCGETLRKQVNKQLYIQYMQQKKKSNSFNGYRAGAIKIIQTLNATAKIKVNIGGKVQDKYLCNLDVNNNEVLRFPIEILKKGFTVQDCEKVIRRMVSNWKYKPDFRGNIRPSVLFNPRKFQEYLIRDYWKEKKWYSDDNWVTVQEDKE